jgi:erythrin-vacuolar iron transport family protein
MTGLIDGSLSTLAPIFSVAIATHDPHTAFPAGTAAATPTCAAALGSAG